MPKKNRSILSAPRSVVFFVKNIREVSDWYAGILGIEPYRDEKEFVGFHLGGCDLCFHKADLKSGNVSGSEIAYWKVESIPVATKLFIAHGASWHRRTIRIPEGGRVCQLKDPFGNIIGLSDDL